MHDVSARFIILKRIIKRASRTILRSGTSIHDKCLLYDRCVLLFFTGQSNKPLLKPAVIKAEMMQILEEFHIRMQRTYCALKIKHRRELLKLRERRTIRVLIEHIHREKYTLEQQV